MAQLFRNQRIVFEKNARIGEKLVPMGGGRGRYHLVLKVLTQIGAPKLALILALLVESILSDFEMGR